ncbi:Pentatricopeptide repeat-containing protein [Glycine soja]
MNESPTSIAILLLNREVLFQPNFEILNPKLKMPPQIPKPTKPRNCGPPFTTPKPTNKFYFFYGHRNPSQNRPTVRGGLFSNRQTLNPNPSQPKPTTKPFNIKNWDPHFLSNPNSNPSPSTLSSASLRLSPIARFIVDAFRRNDNKWCPNVAAELSKLRRITPNLVAEVLKVQTNHTLASKFFHWAGSQRGYHHNFASYNALAYCLNRHHQFRAADQLPELMESQGKPPSEKQFEILIRMHSDANRGLRVYHVYEKMRNKFGVKPRVFLYNRVMDALVRTGHLDLALSVYDDLKEDGLVEESVTFMVLVKGLCKCGRIDEMLEVLGRMRERLCKPDVFAYTALVKILVPAGNLDACLRVWEEMKRDRVEPDVKAYATMIVGLAKGGRVQEGYELFREMKGKGCLVDRVIYGALVEAFVAEGKVELAFDLLKDLVSSGYRADLGIYICLIEGLCNLNRVQKAYKLFQLTVREGLEPDFLTVKPLLVAYAEANRMEEFCKLLEQMQKLGFPVIADLSKFFSVLVEKKGPIMALETFGQLKEKGHVSVEIYNIFMDSLHKIGEVKKALSLFDEMKGLSLKPDSFTYCTAILCLVDLGEIKEACACHNRIIEMSCIPSVAAYSSLTKGLCQIGEIDEAMLLVRDCLGNVSDGPLEFKYSLTIIHACKSNVAEKVIDVLNEMIEQGCSLDNVIYCSIISGMCKHGTIEEARKVFSNLRERNFLTESNTIVYDELLIDHMKKKTADLVALIASFNKPKSSRKVWFIAEFSHIFVDFDEGFPEALLVQLLKVMLHSDVEARVGAHLIFSILLFPSSFHTNEISSLRSRYLGQHNKRHSHAPSVSASASITASLEKLRRNRNTKAENHVNIVHDQERDIVAEDWKQGCGLKNSPNFYKLTSIIDKATGSPSLTDTEPYVMKLTEDQMAQLLSAFWIQANLPDNLPSNIEANLKDRDSLVIRFFQFPLSLWTMLLDQSNGILSPACQRSVYVLSAGMLAFACKIYQIHDLNDVFASLPMSDVDPFLSISDDYRVYAKIHVDVREYGTAADNQLACSVLSELQNKRREC